MPEQDEERAGWIRLALSQFEGPLTRYALRIVGDVETARDVVQETFVRLCQAQREEVQDHLAQWLFTVCRNRALDVRRKESRMNQSPTLSAAESLPDRGVSPSEQAERKQTTDMVLRAVDALPENQREVIRLKFQNGMSYREISEITGLSVSNIGYLIHVSIRALRAELATNGRVS